MRAKYIKYSVCDGAFKPVPSHSKKRKTGQENLSENKKSLIQKRLISYHQNKAIQININNIRDFEFGMLIKPGTKNCIIDLSALKFLPTLLYFKKIIDFLPESIISLTLISYPALKLCSEDYDNLIKKRPS